MKYPNLNKPYTIFFLLVGVSSSILFFYFAVFAITDDRFSRFFVGMLGILNLLGSLYVVYRAASVTITDKYISQGKRKIYWSGAIDAEMKGYELCIVSHNKDKIMISPWAYQNPTEIINSIQMKIKNQ
jgi:hypothetical protein